MNALERHAHLLPFDDQAQAEKIAKGFVHIGDERIDEFAAQMIRWAEAARITQGDYRAGQDGFGDLVAVKLQELRALIVQPLEVAIEGKRRIQEIEAKLLGPKPSLLANAPRHVPGEIEAAIKDGLAHIRQQAAAE